MKRFIFSVVLISSLFASTLLIASASEHTNPKSMKLIFPIMIEEVFLK